MKDHLPVLDGLRGVAALAVVFGHLQHTTFAIGPTDEIWFRHGHLAVDFFYCLSGYVIGYAYDSRRDSLGIREFLILRLIRLHPMVVLGTLFGLLAFTLDPFAFQPGFPDYLQVEREPWWKTVTAGIGGVLLVPSWPLPYRFDAYFPLNAPQWSLMWEYIASIAYAVLLWRLPNRYLLVATMAGGLGLLATAYATNDLNVGWGWGQEFYGLARTSFSFGMGLMLFRSRLAPRWRIGFPALSLIMILIFIAPVAIEDDWNGAYEAAMVIALFPLIVLSGIGARPGRMTTSLCQFLGRISYPLYLMNFPIVMLFMGYYWTVGVDPDYLHVVIFALVVACVALAYISVRFYDEPVRRRLKGIGRSRLAAGEPRLTVT